jgi:hypothetical protein
MLLRSAFVFVLAAGSASGLVPAAAKGKPI